MVRICTLLKPNPTRPTDSIMGAHGMGLSSDHAVGRTCSPAGRAPSISDTARPFGCNLILAFIRHDQLLFNLFEGSFTAAVSIAFRLRRISQQNYQPAFLIADKHPLHRSAKAKK
jgi:hypothetical protein